MDSHRVLILKSPHILRAFYPQGQIHGETVPGAVRRNWATEYRGPIALIHNREILATARLDGMVPIRMGKDSEDGAHGWLWLFQDLLVLETPQKAPWYDIDRWESPRGPEPMGLAAGDDHQLRAYLEALLPAAVQDEPAAEAAPPAEVYEVNKRGQLEMF